MRKFVTGMAFSVLSVLAVAGCSSDLAFENLAESKKALDLSEKSIAMFTICCDNAYNESWLPNVTKYILESQDRSFKKEFEIFGFESRYCRVLKDNRMLKKNMVISVNLKPGKYALSRIRGFTKGNLPGWGIGGFVKSFRFEFTVNPDEICYVGNLEIHSRQKREGEQTEAPLFPLLDQKVSGVLDCYWEVRANDSDVYNDIAFCKSNYPQIVDHLIVVRMGRLFSESPSTP